MWTDDYIGIKYIKDGRSRSGTDCWGLVSMIYKECLNIELPDYSGILKDQSAASLREVTRIRKLEQEKWIRLAKPQLFDLILIRAGLFHVGVVASKKLMIHTIDEIEFSALEDYTDNQWKHRIEGFYHYAG
jgi:cell wall-associated NlpC family hydrolase